MGTRRGRGCRCDGSHVPALAILAPLAIVALPELGGAGAIAGIGSSGTAATVTLGPGGTAALNLSGAVVVAGTQAVAVTAAGTLTLAAVLKSGPGGPQRWNDHHIATMYQPWVKVFEPMFRKAGLNLQSTENFVRLLDHSGPHPLQYHFWVKMELEAATEGLQGAAYESAFKARLADIAAKLQEPGGIEMIRRGTTWWVP